MREYERKTEIFKDKPEKIKSFWDLLGQIAVFWEIFLQKTIAFFRKFCYNNADSIKGGTASSPFALSISFPKEY